LYFCKHIISEIGRFFVFEKKAFFYSFLLFRINWIDWDIKNLYGAKLVIMFIHISDIDKAMKLNFYAFCFVILLFKKRKYLP